MSTGTPVSSVDANPPATGHGHGRGRGHSRSTRYGQVPDPISIHSDLSSARAQPVQPIKSAGYSNGHVSHPSWHGHHRSHSQGSGHYDPWMPSPVSVVFEDHETKHSAEPDTPPPLIEPDISGGYVQVFLKLDQISNGIIAMKL